MITDNPKDGDIIVKDGIASRLFFSFIDQVTRSINENKDEIFTVATVPDATINESMTIYVSDEAGGATLAFSNGTNWLRVQDLAVIS